jgi:ech hydrogenase subunit D
VSMNGEVIIISLDQVVGACAQKKAEAFRFVTMTCTALDSDTVDILYHFDKAYKLEHLRLKVSRHTPLPSISDVFSAAFLVENELQDLFGLRFQGLALDYNQTLYLDQEVATAPFCKYTAASGADAADSVPLSAGE